MELHGRSLDIHVREHILDCTFTGCHWAARNSVSAFGVGNGSWKILRSKQSSCRNVVASGVRVACLERTRHTTRWSGNSKLVLMEVALS